MSSVSSKLFFLSKIGLIGLTISVGIGINLNQHQMTISAVSPVYAQSACSTIQTVSFSGRTSGSMTGKPNITTNMRANPSTSASVLLTIPANTMLSFSGWTYGTSVSDLWTGSADQRWFRVTYQGRTGWVASGVIYGNPPNAPVTCIGGGASIGGMHRNPTAFFSWAKQQVGIRRLDRSDLRGQCVTLIARYLQEVYLTGSQRTAPIAIGHGKDTARIVPQIWPHLFHPPTTAGLPIRGAIISFPSLGGGYGHVAIVVESRWSGGQRQVRIIDSNGDSRAENSAVREYSYWINIPDGRSQGYGTGIYWSNPK